MPERFNVSAWETQLEEVSTRCSHRGWLGGVGPTVIYRGKFVVA